MLDFRLAKTDKMVYMGLEGCLSFVFFVEVSRDKLPS